MTWILGGQLGRSILGTFELAQSPTAPAQPILVISGSRDLADGTRIASAASTIHPVVFVKMRFDGGNVNLHTELGDIAFNGDTYNGVGKLGGIGAMEENSDLSRTPISLSLSGLPNDLITILLSEQYQGRLATIFLGYLDLSTRILVATPTIIYQGNMDTANFSIDQTFSISLSVESRFAAWETPLIRRYNNSDQQSRYPGDTGLEFITQAADKTIWWGQPTP